MFPYSQSTQGPPTSLVPYAIEEADKLYNSHLFVSLGLYQLWEAREECLREERGLGRSGLIGFSSMRLDDDEDEAAEVAMQRDMQWEEEEMRAEAKGDTEGVKLAKEKRAAARRLYRVEVIYVRSPSVTFLTPAIYAADDAEHGHCAPQAVARDSDWSR